MLLEDSDEDDDEDEEELPLLLLLPLLEEPELDSADLLLVTDALTPDYFSVSSWMLRDEIDF